MATSSSSAVQADVFPDGTTDYKPLRSQKYDTKKPHLSELPMTWSNWYQHVNWLNTTMIIFIPIIGLIASYWVRLQWKTAAFAVFYYFNTGLGITAGKRVSLQRHHARIKLTLSSQDTIVFGPTARTRPPFP
jgi:stearoyl-CoA desaturase (delta-9 desaturase)